MDGIRFGLIASASLVSGVSGLHAAAPLFTTTRPHPLILPKMMAEADGSMSITRTQEEVRLAFLQSGLSLRESVRINEVTPPHKPMLLELEGLQILCASALMLLVPTFSDWAWDALLFVPLLGLLTGSWLAVLFVLFDLRFFWSLGWHVRMASERLIKRTTASGARAFYLAERRGVVKRCVRLRRAACHAAVHARVVLSNTGVGWVARELSMSLAPRVARWRRQRRLVSHVNKRVAKQRAAAMFGAKA